MNASQSGNFSIGGTVFDSSTQEIITRHDASTGSIQWAADTQDVKTSAKLSKAAPTFVLADDAGGCHVW